MSDPALLAAAEAAARAAGNLLRKRPQRVEHKGAIDLVTEIDLASEACIRAHLAPLGIAMQGEEGGGASTGLRWVVDPVDGTTNFVHGYPCYCVSIALVDDATPIAGAIYDPIRDAMHLASAGGGASRNGVPLRVSDVRSLADALGVTGFPNDRRENAALYLSFVERVLLGTHGIRRSGSAAMDLATLAVGQCDFFWEFGLKPWDTAAGALLVREAGGNVTALDGGAWGLEAPAILATNGWIHEEVVRMFA